MALYADPAMVKSNFMRMPKDRYWTDAWLTQALLDTVEFIDPEGGGTIFEPSAGRGDMARILSANGFQVLASDIDLSEFDELSAFDSWEADFLDTHFDDRIVGAEGIISNPPYRLQLAFIRHGLKLLKSHKMRYMAMLLRSEFKSGSKEPRRSMMGGSPHYAGEVVITRRPRWDWWLPRKIDPETGQVEKQISPRHNYSWFLWTAKPNKFHRQWFWYPQK